MSEFARPEGRRAAGGRTITLEEYRRRDDGPQREQPAPLRGTPIVVGAELPKAPWRQRALCATQGIAPTFFFPKEGDAGAPARIRAFCANCEVSGDCLMWAVMSNAKDGWFGGKSPKQRRQYIPSTSRSHGTNAMYRYGMVGNDTSNGCRCDVCRDYVSNMSRRSRLNRAPKGRAL